ncbi:MAG: leucyl/phenylalanyl-tRNA--protein transferase [Pseudomonadota bacterium]
MKDTEPEFEITPELLLRAYAAGVFPMADGADADEIFWVEPRRRGILPLEDFHLSRSLRKRLRRNDFVIGLDTDFAGVVAACADRNETWINGQIANLYAQLHEMGHAHSVEVWQEGALIGGLYGVSIGGAFFGESMFTRRRDGSKIALAHLVARLRAGGYTLLDTQFTTDHLQSLGAVTVTRQCYRALLEDALARPGDFFALDHQDTGAVMQVLSHTS